MLGQDATPLQAGVACEPAKGELTSLFVEHDQCADACVLALHRTKTMTLIVVTFYVARRKSRPMSLYVGLGDQYHLMI